MSMKSKTLLKKRNTPPVGEPFVWHTREMLESEAWRSMRINTRRVVERIEIEHMDHGGQENGNLPVTYADFAKHGVREKSIKLAIADAADRGLIIVTVRGRASVGPDRWPTRFALGWLPLFDGAAAPNRWKAWRRLEVYRHNIESTRQSARRENGANIGSLPGKCPVAPTRQSARRETAETLNSLPGKVPVGEKTSEQPGRLPKLAGATIISALAEARAAVSDCNLSDRAGPACARKMPSLSRMPPIPIANTGT